MAEEQTPDIASLLERIRSFNRERNWQQFHSPKNLAAALAVEAAELLEPFQWLTEEQSSALSPEERKRVRDEIGDVLIYLLNLADRLDIDPLSAAWQKLQSNEKKYPPSRCRGSAAKYTAYFPVDK